ncbi:Phage protein [Ralstonia solanacearum UW551]|uniref:Phage protein n=1 Tax=Ralstonia solanacearum (strain UW551) TaxID=342110 RepID=A0AB33V776_RALSU|nr:Phage protein [Ralstonia solanacearum UW551]
MPSAVSLSSSVRSNFAAACPASTPSIVSPSSSRFSPTASEFSHDSAAWNTGLCDRLRTGLTRSTTCSNGRSWCAWASSTRPFTRSSSSDTVTPLPTSTLSASVFTKKPISPSTSLRVRFATGEPTTTSSCPDRRLSNADHPASTVMNSVVPCRWLSFFKAALSVSSNTTSTEPPA